MNDVMKSPSTLFSKSSIFIPKIKNKGKFPKFLANTYITFSPNTNKKKSNTTFISDLINSNKKLIKNNSRYKSYVQLPKAVHHRYPYKPDLKTEKRRILSCKIHSRSNLELSNVSTCKSLEISKTSLISIKLGQKRDCCKLNLDPASLNKVNVNENIFFDFVEGWNNKSKIKEEFNIYIKKHPVNENSDVNIFKLYDLLQNFKFYNEMSFYNNKHTTKINEFKLSNSLYVKIKISPLKIIFYEVNQKSNLYLKTKDNLNSSSTINNNSTKFKNVSFNTKIKFPFEFIPFFYGINFIDFLQFLIAVIEYDYSKNKFYLDFKRFTKAYRIYKNNTTFYGEGSYFQEYNNKNNEFFIYEWDVKSKNGTSHYIIKIVLPQAKINVNLENKSVYKFLSTIKPNNMTYFLKEDFKLWDLHILKFFSEYKMFRQEVNKIICDKYINNEKNSNFNGKTKIKSKFYENVIKKNKNIYKKKFYFNKTKSNNDNINNKMQEKNFFFFFSQNINNINEGYFFQIIMPKIHVYFDYQNSLMNKYFELDIKQMYQIHKLRKSFALEDLIKYSLEFVDQKKQFKRKNSAFEICGRRNMKRSATLHYIESPEKRRLRTGSTRIARNMNFNESDKFNILRQSRKKLTKKFKNIMPEESDKKDLNLNLDKYIFNIDDDILKFIEPRKEEKSPDKNKAKTICIYKGGKIHKKANIDFGKLKLIWTNQDLKGHEYAFEDDEIEYLFENPTLIWEKYIENKINEYKNKVK